MESILSYREYSFHHRWWFLVRNGNFPILIPQLKVSQKESINTFKIGIGMPHKTAHVMVTISPHSKYGMAITDFSN